MKHSLFGLIGLLCSLVACANAPAVAATVSAAAATPSPATVDDFGGARFRRQAGAHDFVHNYDPQIAGIPGLFDHIEALRSKAYRQWQEDVAEINALHAEGVDYGDINTNIGWAVKGRAGNLVNAVSTTSMATGGAHGLFGIQSILWDSGRKQVLSSPLVLFSDRLESVKAQYYEALDAERERLSSGAWEAPTGVADLHRPPYSKLQFSFSGRYSNKFDTIHIIANPEVAETFSVGIIGVNIPITQAILKTIKPEFRASFAVAEQAISTGESAPQPSYAMNSFAMVDKAGNRQLHMISPIEAGTGGDTGELCIPGSNLCMTILPQSEEIGCSGDGDICDRVNGTAGEAPTVLRVRQNFANEQMPNHIQFAPLNINIPIDAEISLYPLVTLAANVKMDGKTPQSATIGVFVKQTKRQKTEVITSTRLHMLQAKGLGSHAVNLTELISLPTTIEVRRLDKTEDGSINTIPLWGALGVPVLDAKNSEIVPAYDYFLGGAAQGALESLLNDVPGAKDLSDLKDKMTSDQCQMIRKLIYNPVTERYEFDRPPLDCRFLSARFGVQ